MTRPTLEMASWRLNLSLSRSRTPVAELAILDASETAALTMDDSDPNKLATLATLLEIATAVGALSQTRIAFRALALANRQAC